LQLLWDAIAGTDASLQYTLGEYAGGPRASSSVRQRAQIDAAFLGLPVAGGGLFKLGAGASRSLSYAGLQPGDIGHLLTAYRKQPKGWTGQEGFLDALGGRGIPDMSEFSRLYRMYRSPKRHAAAAYGDVLTGSGDIALGYSGLTGFGGFLVGMETPLQPDDLDFSSNPLLLPYQVGVLLGGTTSFIID
jgi:hypothetical protein